MRDTKHSPPSADLGSFGPSSARESSKAHDSSPDHTERLSGTTRPDAEVEPPFSLPQHGHDADGLLGCIEGPPDWRRSNRAFVHGEPSPVADYADVRRPGRKARAGRGIYFEHATERPRARGLHSLFPFSLPQSLPAAWPYDAAARRTFPCARGAAGGRGEGGEQR